MSNFSAQTMMTLALIVIVVVLLWLGFTS